MSVEGWVAGVTEPPDPLAVNGELYRVAAKLELGGSAAPREAVPPPVTLPRAPAAVSTTGTPIVPPMPGKVVELRVSVGDRVVAGQVLLVLEAMKMRNEIASPSAGRVLEIRVSTGDNVRAREPMLLLGPD